MVRYRIFNTTTKFIGRACAVHGNSLPVVVDKVDKSALRSELFMNDVLKNDESVKFYMGIPTLVCLTAIFNFLKPFAGKLKNCDTNKGKKVKFQKKPVKKSGKKSERSDNLSRICFELG